MIVAATNHPGILDQAPFRRFDDVVEYHLPSTSEIQELLRIRLGRYINTTRVLDELAGEAGGLSHAEVGKAIDDAVKESIMQDREDVAPETIRVLLQQRQLARRRTLPST